MIDRDSYSPGPAGYDEFLSDARALLAIARSYAAFDVSLERAMASADSQRLVDGARRSIAASAVDELATLADLLADVARELGAPIEEDLRAAKRLIDLTFDEANLPRLRAPQPVEAMLFAPADLPELRA